MQFCCSLLFQPVFFTLTFPSWNTPKTGCCSLPSADMNVTSHNCIEFINMPLKPVYSFALMCISSLTLLVFFFMFVTLTVCGKRRTRSLLFPVTFFIVVFPYWLPLLPFRIVQDQNAVLRMSRDITCHYLTVIDTNLVCRSDSRTLKKSIGAKLFLYIWLFLKEYTEYFWNGFNILTSNTAAKWILHIFFLGSVQYFILIGCLSVFNNFLKSCILFNSAERHCWIYKILTVLVWEVEQPKYHKLQPYWMWLQIKYL